jgi:hypothetical protein
MQTTQTVRRIKERGEKAEWGKLLTYNVQLSQGGFGTVDHGHRMRKGKNRGAAREIWGPSKKKKKRKNRKR